MIDIISSLKNTIDRTIDMSTKIMYRVINPISEI